jgi:hypothetical protein
MFIPASDSFTLDVADFIGKAAEAAAVEDFLKAVRRYTVHSGNRSSTGRSKNITPVCTSKRGHR